MAAPAGAKEPRGGPSRTVWGAVVDLRDRTILPARAPGAVHAAERTAHAGAHLVAVRIFGAVRPDVFPYRRRHSAQRASPADFWTGRRLSGLPRRRPHCACHNSPARRAVPASRLRGRTRVLAPRISETAG